MTNSVLASLFAIAASAAIVDITPVPHPTEDELISGAARMIAEAALKRNHISCEERAALFILNRVLVDRGSEHQISVWTLPEGCVLSRQPPWPR